MDVSGKRVCPGRGGRMVTPRKWPKRPWFVHAVNAPVVRRIARPHVMVATHEYKVNLALLVAPGADGPQGSRRAATRRHAADHLRHNIVFAPVRSRALVSRASMAAVVCSGTGTPRGAKGGCLANVQIAYDECSLRRPVDGTFRQQHEVFAAEFHAAIAWRVATHRQAPTSRIAGSCGGHGLPAIRW